MAKERLPFIDCFQGRDKQAALPVPVPANRLDALITASVQILIDAIVRKFPTDLQQKKRQQNTGRVRALETRLRENIVGDGNGELRTLADIQRTYRKVREMIREACAPHREYPDRKMDDDVIGAIEKSFCEQAERMRAEIETQLKEAEKPKTEEQRKARTLALHACVCRSMSKRLGHWLNAQQRPLVSNGETVNADNLALFAEFLFCIDEAVNAAGQHDKPLHQEAAQAVSHYCDGDHAKRKLFVSWLASIPFEQLQKLARQNDGDGEFFDVHVNGNGIHTSAQSILLPRKAQFVQQRTEPEGGPMWQMTQEELLVLGALRSQRAASQIAAEDDLEFHAHAAHVVNARCSGGLPLVRAAVEIRQALDHMSAMEDQAARRDAPVATVPVVPPPPVAPAPVPVAMPAPEEPAAPPPTAWDQMDPDAILGLLDSIADDTNGGREPELTQALTNLQLPRWQYQEWLSDRGDIALSSRVLAKLTPGSVIEGRVPPFLQRLLLARIRKACAQGQIPSDELLAEHGLTRARYDRWTHSGERREPTVRRPKPAPAPQSPRWMGRASEQVPAEVVQPAVTQKDAVETYVDAASVPPPMPAVQTKESDAVGEGSGTHESTPADLALIVTILDQRDEILRILSARSSLT